MKKLSQVFTLLVLLLGTGSVYSQVSVFTQSTPYEDIDNTPDSLFYQFTGVAAGASGTPTLTIHFEGDFGASTEFITFYGEGGFLIGSTQPYFDGSDCMIDSTFLTIPVAMINLWAADDTINIYGVTTDQVDLFCTTNHAMSILTYDYCPSGMVAAISTPETHFCPLDGSVLITTSPSGGTLTGAGLTGNSFSPSGLTPDSTYSISYSFVDTAGCPSIASVFMNISSAPDIAPVDTICPNNSVQLSADFGGDVIWFTDLALTQSIDTGSTITSPSIDTTTTFYASAASTDRYFMITSLSDTGSVVIDHDASTGDDRGGIAVTTSYVYIVGDDSTTRFDLDLNNPVSYGIRADGIFSDLGTGQLYTLYNPIVGIPDANNIDSFYVTHLQILNADLTLGANVALTDSIAFGWDNNYDYQSGIFPGNGFVIIYSSPKTAWYVVDIATGLATRLSQEDFISSYYSENFANWGIGEFDGTDYSVVYRNDFTSNVHRYSILANTDVLHTAFSDLSDMASFTYAPWNNRWYFHYEGSGQFGGSSETLGYSYGTDSTGSLQTVLLGCPNAVTVNVAGCAGIEDQNTVFNLYPVPSNGLLNIQATNNINDWNVTVMNISGAAVYQTKLFAGEIYGQIDLSSVAAGVYFVKFENNQSSETIKIVVQH